MTKTGLSLGRRTIMIGGGTVAGAALLGAAWFASSDPVDLVLSLMRRALPGVRLDGPSARACAQDALEQFESSLSANQRGVSLLKLTGIRIETEVMGVEGAASSGPFADRLADITRVAITRLLTNSNFFSVTNPRAELIVYDRPDPNVACRNPFANLSPPR